MLRPLGEPTRALRPQETVTHDGPPRPEVTRV